MRAGFITPARAVAARQADETREGDGHVDEGTPVWVVRWIRDTEGHVQPLRRQQVQAVRRDGTDPRARLQNVRRKRLGAGLTTKTREDYP